jgi:hypothetical protein
MLDRGAVASIPLSARGVTVRESENIFIRVTGLRSGCDASDRILVIRFGGSEKKGGQRVVLVLHVKARNR